MSRILFLSQRMPYPPDKGEKIRAFHILRHLSQKHEVYLGCFVDDEKDWAHLDALGAFCTEIQATSWSWMGAQIRAVLALPTRRPLTCAYYSSAHLRQWAGQVLRKVQPEALFIYSAAMAQYVDKNGPLPSHRVMDFVDVDSDKWRQYAGSKSWPLSWVYAREAKTLLAHDRQVAQSMTACTFVSEDEARLFQSLAPDSADTTLSLPNGVDSAYFAPGEFAAPFQKDHGPVFVFTGTMDYWPNVDAVVWFCEDILPRIRQTHEGAQFYVVGNRPDKSVLALGARPGVTVTGRVDDVRPFIQHSTAIVAPMRLARGVQNKVLEGMAMAKAVITTPQGLEGIAAQDGRHLLVAEQAEDIARQCCAAYDVAVAEHLGNSARQLVIERYSWEAALAKLDGLLGLA